MKDEISKILTSLGIHRKVLLGKGGEGEVYEVDDERVLKIYGNTNRNYLQALKKFQEELFLNKFSFQTPQILEIKQINNKLVTFEKKLTGVNGEKLFERVSDTERKTLLINFLNGLDEISKLQLKRKDYGQIIKNKKSITTKRWDDYLIKKLEQRLKKTEEYLKKDVKSLDDKVGIFKKVLSKEFKKCPKKLVHHDYYLNNVLMTSDLKLSAVLDFSPHTVVGDWRMDVCGAVTFLGINSEARKYISFMKNLAQLKYGREILKVIDTYLVYYSVYYASTYEFDKKSYYWCVNNLNNENLWKTIVND